MPTGTKNGQNDLIHPKSPSAGGWTFLDAGIDNYFVTVTVNNLTQGD